MRYSVLASRKRDPQIVHNRYQEAVKNGDYRSALKEAVTLTKISPKSSQSDALALEAAASLYLQKWREAKNAAVKALRQKPQNLLALDVISHAAAHTGDPDIVRKFGSRALDLRAASVESRALFDPRIALPPPPSGETQTQNIIAFSLFGANPKYCETAVLNSQLQPSIYPNWTCRFYVDQSVPDHVIGRLRENRSEIICVDGSEVAKWPGPMWRFAAHDDDVHRTIFRDADSLLSHREAIAVNEWIESGELFHHIRDFGSHTELMLAGLWGCVAGALPPMREAIKHYMVDYTKNVHFADQFFLRSEIWPHIRGQLASHDSVFGWRDSKPLPEDRPYEGFHVGCVEGQKISINCEQSDGTNVAWTIYVRVGDVDHFVGRYRAIVEGGKVHAILPRSYCAALVDGTMNIKVAQAE